MAWRSACLSILLILIVVVRFAISILPQAEVTDQWSVPTDPESQLAAGRRLSILCADQSALELISGVSTRLSSYFIKNRYQLARIAQQDGERAALLTVPGIAEKRVDTFLRYLSFERRCTGSEPHLPFTPPTHARIPTR